MIKKADKKTSKNYAVNIMAIATVTVVWTWLFLSFSNPSRQTDSFDTTVKSAESNDITFPVKLGYEGTGNTCKSRGIAYYESIGSYPTLSDGRSAYDVVKARCSKTSTAF